MNPSPPVAPIDLTVILVNWNTAAMTCGCLRSVARDLAGAGSLAVETILVDNASTDDSVARLRAEFPWVHLIENRTNVGFARANNQGIAVSRGRCVLLLNSDTLVQAGALAALVGHLDAHPRVGAVGARLLDPDGSLQPSCSRFPTLGRELWRLFHLDRVQMRSAYAMQGWDARTPRPVDVVSGACLMVRRPVLDQVGPLDEGYFMYSEEVDLCRRIRRAGWEIDWAPAARVIHFGGQSSRLMAEAMFLQLYRSKVLYFRKHHGPAAAAAYKGILAAAALARLALSPLASMEPAPQRMEHRRLAASYHHLLRDVWSY